MLFLPFQPFVDEFIADEFYNDFASKYAADSKGFIQQKVARKFLRDLTLDVQENIGSVCNLRSCVIRQMMSDRSLLGRLFKISGKDELIFLVDSGLVFGFILGMLQLMVSLYLQSSWTLSIGGLVVGLATNWLALKWIFEPVNSFKIGPIVLQGLFLRRQKEVSADFSKFFANKVLTSRQLWCSMLTDPTTLPKWEKLLATRFSSLTRDLTLGMVNLEEQKPKKLKAASAKACANLFGYLTNLHEYVDEALEIEQTLRARMIAMTSAQFERVLHPIFEEDEMTLILSGGALGFLAGFIQQLLSTGLITLPRFNLWGKAKLAQAVISFVSIYVFFVAMKPKERFLLYVARLMVRTRRLKKRTYSYLRKGRRGKKEGRGNTAA